MKLDLRSTLVATVCLFVLPAQAALAEKLPTSIEVLTRMVQAHKSLGPATMTFTITTMEKGKTIPASVSGVEKRNDASHSVTSARMRIKDMDLYRMRVYVNGKSEVTLDETKGEYRRGKADDPSKMTSIVHEISESLNKPKERAKLAKVPVQSTTMDSQPVWRLSWLETDTPKDTDGPVRVTLIIGRADSFLRKFAFVQRDGSGLSVTTSIKHQQQRFPVETFVFSAPPGTKEATE